MRSADPDELSHYLASLERENCYQLDAVLKESDCETTQQVSFIGANGVAGRTFVRKLIKRDSGLGKTYERIYSAQQNGQRFKHIPAILECYYRDDLLVVIMEFVQGETLQDAVDRNGPSLKLALDLFPRLCDAVSELHEEFDPPIIHRDLKPSNLIFSKGGLVIIDYGIARDYRDGAESDTTHFGTRPFAPPEQFGFGQTTVRSDVYALGMVLRFCLTGEITARGAAEKDANAARVPAEIQALIAQATALDPAARFASAQALKTAFLKAASQEGEPASAYPQASYQEGKPASTYPHVASRNDEPAGRAIATMPQAQPKGYFSNGGKLAALGVAWNLTVVIALGFFLAGCIAVFADPQTSSLYPLWFRIIGYLVLLPLFFCACAWLLIDKRRLRNRFPALQQFKAVHWIILCAISFVVMFFGIGVLILILGPTNV